MSTEAAHQGFAAVRVPVSAQGSGWRIFFIVAGSLCGLPVFILSARVFGCLGFIQGVKAVLVGAAVSAALGACTAYAGSRARMGLAMLTDRAFGRLGASIVKTIIALALVGWFGVNIGVLGATAASAITQMAGLAVPALAIGIPVCIAIAAVTVVGATGLERLGIVVVPVTVIVLCVSVLLVGPHLALVWSASGSGALSFGQAVSAIVGSYIVGIVIQPDYARFVRRPSSAALGAGAALGLAFPLVLTVASLASLTSRTPELISAMILLGFGAPALLVLILGAWIDSSACLYSASLSLVNQFPRLRFAIVVAGVTVLGIVLVTVGADTAFIPFLIVLGLCLPPLASVLVCSTILFQGASADGDRAGRAHHVTALVSWAVGTLVGISASNGLFAFSGLPTLDSIVSAATFWSAASLIMHRSNPVPRDAGDQAAKFQGQYQK